MPADGRRVEPMPRPDQTKGGRKAMEIKLGKYRHFKGEEYEVLGLATHSETQEEMVLYRALYGEGGLWVRPAAMWSQWVRRDAYEGPRFIYLEDNHG